MLVVRFHSWKDRWVFCRGRVFVQLVIDFHDDWFWTEVYSGSRWLLKAVHLHSYILSGFNTLFAPGNATLLESQIYLGFVSGLGGRLLRDILAIIRCLLHLLVDECLKVLYLLGRCLRGASLSVIGLLDNLGLVVLLDVHLEGGLWLVNCHQLLSFSWQRLERPCHRRFHLPTIAILRQIINKPRAILRKHLLILVLLFGDCNFCFSLFDEYLG